MVRFRALRAQTGRSWLALAALALGVGLWGTNVIALLGFGVSDLPIGHDALLTQLSAVVCVGATAPGLLLAETRRTRPGAVAAGAVMTAGFTGAFVLGTSALDAPARFHTSVGIAVVGIALTAMAMAAVLWLTTTVVAHRVAVAVSALSAALLCAAQYVNLAALTASSTRTGTQAGADPNDPTLTIAVTAVLALVALTVAFNLYITPAQDVRNAPAPLAAREMPEYLLMDGQAGDAPAVGLPVPVTTGDDLVVEAGPVLRVGG
nr:MHYT domain-containing protein [Streptomyces adustus]